MIEIQQNELNHCCIKCLEFINNNDIKIKLQIVRMWFKFF